MERKSIDVAIQEAGSLIYLADSKFGGLDPGEFHNFFGGAPGLKELTLQGSVMAGSLYQDDGYSVRILFGDLSEQEMEEWTSKISWKIDASSGRIALSGVCDEDLEEYMSDWTTAEDQGSYHLGTYIEVPPTVYSVTIYSYPPGDLAGGWMRIEDRLLFRQCFGKDSGLEFEKPIDYFKRTRPNETPRHWHLEGWEDKPFLSFLIHFTPDSAKAEHPEFEPDGCLAWEYRKPERCPVGIELPLID